MAMRTHPSKDVHETIDAVDIKRLPQIQGYPQDISIFVRTERTPKIAIFLDNLFAQLCKRGDW